MSKDGCPGTQLSPQEEVGQCPLESPQGGRSFPRLRADSCLEGLVSMGHLLTDGGRTKEGPGIPTGTSRPELARPKLW